MEIMVSLLGDDVELPYIPEISQLHSGIELGGYGLGGVKSEQEWKKRFLKHQVIRKDFKGNIALHGPFIGIEYDHEDCLIREAIEKRMNMLFEAAIQLNASRVILHSGFTSEIEQFNLTDSWFKRNCSFWRNEIARWETSNIKIVLENITEKSPDILIKLIDEVNNPFLGLCFDIGHANIFSNIEPSVWVKLMGARLQHIHLHDNDRKADRHWRTGKGIIDFKTFYNAVEQNSPKATISIEIVEKIDIVMEDLRKLVERFVGKINPNS